MSIVESGLIPPLALPVPRLAASATSPFPAWLWSADGSRILWANAVGAGIFGAPDSPACAGLRFGLGDAALAQVVRLAATLPGAGKERFERLHGFGVNFGRALTCVCSRIAMADGTPAIFIAGTEPAGPALALDERVRRLFPAEEGVLGAFATDGRLLFASSTVRAKLDGAATLSSLGLSELAGKALESGDAAGPVRLGQGATTACLRRLGEHGWRVLVLTLAAQGNAEGASSIGEKAEPAHTGAEPPASAMPDRAAADRRHPLRFVWQMDADGRFVIGSDEFIDLVGPRTIAACGRPWSEIAAELQLDKGNEVARAVATHETWSGIPVLWPVDESDGPLQVELSGLPVFDRNRAFCGYRGFGVCRDVTRINELTRARQAHPIGFVPAPAELPQSTPAARKEVETAAASAGAVAAASAASFPSAPQAVAAAPASQDGAALANVVPFRAAGAGPEARAPSLSPVERSAFRELAQELSARLRNGPEEALAAGTVEISQADNPHVAEAPAAAASRAVEVPVAAEPPLTEPAKPVPAEHVLLDRIPAGVLVYRDGVLLYGNRHFFELSGYPDLAALAAAGGLNSLFVEPVAGAPTPNGQQRLSMRTRRGEEFPVDGRLSVLPWNGAPATALVVTSGQPAERQRAIQAALDAAENDIRTLKSSLERTVQREAQKSSAARADFLAKVSHEIRTPLNAMIGFAEVIMAERFGSIGNERYREYLKDMHAAGTHVVSLLNDLIDLSKVEAGQLELNITNVDLNDLIQQCVAIMQPEANRARIIIRSSLTPKLTEVAADARALRQIVFNLLGHAIKFTGPGGQVIVSTALADGGEAVLRVRDTGSGMRENEVEALLDPFRQTASSASWGSEAGGLSLPLTKALAEANRARFGIKSAPNAGTLVEIAFPPSRAAPH